MTHATTSSNCCRALIGMDATTYCSFSLCLAVLASLSSPGSKTKSIFSAYRARKGTVLKMASLGLAWLGLSVRSGGGELPAPHQPPTNDTRRRKPGQQQREDLDTDRPGRLERGKASPGDQGPRTRDEGTRGPGIREPRDHRAKDRP